MTEEKNVTRRSYAKYAGAGIVVIAVAGAGAYYATRQGPTTAPPPSQTTPGPTTPEATTPTQTPSTTAAPTTLRVMSYQHAGTTGLKAALPDFEKLYPHITIEIETYPWAVYREKMVADLVAEQGTYDVLVVNCENVPEFANSGWLVPIGDKPDLDEVDLSDFMEAGLWNHATWGCPYMSEENPWKDEYKKYLYGFPYMVWTQVLTYRKDIFENAEEKNNFRNKYGYELRPPVKIDEFTDVAHFFTRKKGELLAGEKLEEDFYGYTHGFSKYWLDYQWYAWLYSSGGEALTEDLKPVLNSEIAVESLTWYLDLFKKEHVMPPETPAYAFDEIVQALTDGRTAMITFWEEDAGSFIDPTKSKYWDKLSFAPFPYKSPATASHSLLGGIGMAINSFSKNKDVAWNFIKWACGKEALRTIALEAAGTSRKSIVRDPEIVAKYPWFPVKDKAVASGYPILGKYGRLPEFPQLIESVAIQCQHALFDEKSVKQALDDSAAEWEEILKSSGYYD